MAKSFTLGKGERLKSRKLIDQLFSTGQRFNNGPFRVTYAFGGDEAVLQFGIGAGTRHFAKAADRNRVKRLSREAWRLSNTILKQAVTQQKRSLYVFLVYTGKELPEYATVLNNMEKIISNLVRLLNEKNNTTP